MRRRSAEEKKIIFQFAFASARIVSNILIHVENDLAIDAVALREPHHRSFVAKNIGTTARSMYGDPHCPLSRSLCALKCFQF